MEKRFDEGDALLPVQLTDHVFGNEKRDGCHYAKSEADPEHAVSPRAHRRRRELRAKPSEASRLPAWLWFTDR
jgi:hypothetical protein